MNYDYRLDFYYDDSNSEYNENLCSQLNIHDRYSEFSEIASGGMKTIYRVFDSKTQRYVAYATLKKDADSDSKDLFIKEARLTAKLNHPNIIPIYNIGLDEKECPFFTMELKSGDSLQDIIGKIKEPNILYKDKYSLRELLNIFSRICDAVAFAHSKKVVHLDLKPENVQVGGYGEVILCDWGLSKIYDQQSDTDDINQKLLDPSTLNTNTIDGQIKGSPGYFAPEQITGEKKTPQTDIFSLGCLLYSLVCYEAPFRGNDLYKLLEKTVKGEYTIKGDIPDSVKAVINKAMSKNPDDRYKSVTRLKEDIENFLNGYATEAEQASSLKLLKLFILRNKAISFISLVSLLVLLIGGLAFIFNIQKEKSKAEENLALFKAQKQTAEQALASFKSQQEKTSKAQKEHYEILVKNQGASFHKFYYDSPFKRLRAAEEELKILIKAYPQFTTASSALGYHFFIKQEFKKAYQILKENPGSYSYLLPVLDKYKDLKEDSEFLNSPQFLSLLNEFEANKPLLLKMLILYKFKDINKNKNQEDGELLIHGTKLILANINPGWDPKNFNYNAERKSLVISGDKFTRVSMGYGKNSVLEALKLETLVLRGTSVRELRVLEDSSIRLLDVANTQLSFINLQKALPETINKVILAKGQFNNNQIARLKERIEVQIIEE